MKAVLFSTAAGVLNLVLTPSCASTAINASYVLFVGWTIVLFILVKSVKVFKVTYIFLTISLCIFMYYQLTDKIKYINNLDCQECVFLGNFKESFILKKQANLEHTLGDWDTEKIKRGYIEDPSQILVDSNCNPSDAFSNYSTGKWLYTLSYFIMSLMSAVTIYRLTLHKNDPARIEKDDDAVPLGLSIIREDADPNCHVIFIHGFLSDGVNCWRNENGCYWPKLLADNQGLKNTSVSVFTYKTSVTSGNFSIRNIVSDLKEEMKLSDVLKCDRVIFVCHSMGGIVARRYVTSEISYLPASIRFGFFLVASPSLGSIFARLASPLGWILGNSQVRALRFAENNDWLNDLNEDFKKLISQQERRIEGKELIEDKFVFLSELIRIPVVGSFSASRYFSDSYKVPNSDHFSIAKPKDANAIQQRLLIAFLDRWKR